MGLTTNRKGKQMNRSIRISVIAHLLLMLSFVTLTRIKSQASVSKPAHMQLTYLARSTQAPAIRLVHHKAVKVAAAPAALCFNHCHPTNTHAEIFMFDGLTKKFVAVLPNGAHLHGFIQDPANLQVTTDASLPPGDYLVTISTTDDRALPTNWDMNHDTANHFTYVRVDGPGTYSLEQK
jgi:hypothetical protein